MSVEEPSFSVGIEEEYLLVDKDSRDLASSPPPAFMEQCEEALPGNVSPEFLRCQIEVGTAVCSTFKEAHTALAHFRKTLSEKGEPYGLAPIAAATHPFAEWDKQHHTDKDRYNALAMDMKVVVQRLLICGMHVHVGIEDPALRMDIFNQIPYFLPHLLALSTSSPFWRGHLTGLRSYRLAVFNELPRTGLPATFASDGEYRRTVGILTKAGIIEDATKIWWDLRPSDRFPTLEIRIMDSCTRVKDAISIAALFRCLCRMLYRLRCDNQRWRQYSNFLIEENRWQAQRHGVSGSLIDFGRGECVPYVDLHEELLELVAEDAAFFGCEEELEYSRNIVAEGTSADRQIAIFEAALAEGLSERDAQKKIVDHLVEDTLRDC